MRYANVLLIVPSLDTYMTSIAGSPLLSTGYISEALDKAGIEHRIFDMTLGYSMKDLERTLKTASPDLVGITLWSFGYQETYNFIKHIKRIFPSVAVVVGGPHVSTLRKEVLEACDAIDYGVVLEGEETIVELCRGVECLKIKGLIHRKNGDVIYNGDRPFITDLDAMGFPRYEKFELQSYPLKKIFITTSRGCPYRCIYCPVADAIGRKFRMRSADAVVDEIAYWYERGYQQIDIQDDNFTLVPDRTRDICEKLLSRGFSDLVLTCNNGVRADRVTKDLLLLMFRSGIREISLGVEASNDRLLAVLRKGETIVQIEQAISWACEIGFKVQLFFIVGSPTETYADFVKSTEIALKYPVYDARFYNLIPFPRTELYEYALKNNQLLTPYSEYLNKADHYLNEPYMVSQEFSREERCKALVYGRKVSRIVMRKYVSGILSRKYGRLIGSPMSHLICSSWFIHLSRSNRHIKKIVYLVRTYIIHKK